MKKYIFKKIDTTNKKAEEISKSSPNFPFSVIACEQTAGIGRKGSKYFCPKGGVWLTYVDKFRKSVGNRYSLLAALAVTRILDEYDIKTSIKWPNDVYLNGKKLAGVLTIVKKIVFVGIGVNTNIKFFPRDLKDLSTSTFIGSGISIDNDEFLSKLLDTFQRLLLSPTKHIKEIQERMLWLGKKVAIISDDKRYSGVFNGITNEGFAKVGNKFFIDGSMRSV